MPENKKKKRPDYLARYSSMAVKMVAIILGGVFLGRWADEQTSFETPVFTLICSLLFVALAIYVFIRDSSK